MDVVRVVMRGCADVADVGLAFEYFAGDALGDAPGLRLRDLERLALAGEGELASLVAVPVLEHDAADARGVKAARDAVQHNLRHRRLALFRLAAGFEIDRLREAMLLAARLALRDQRRIVRAVAARHDGGMGRRRQRRGLDRAGARR